MHSLPDSMRMFVQFVAMGLMLYPLVFGLALAEFA